MEKLALLGGEPVLGSPLPRYRSFGESEVEAVVRVIRSGVLSGFYGGWCDEYWGGAEVKGFEEEWARAFRVKHAVSVNSATSGLYAAMGAVGIGPGDEVIVPPYTMSATVVAPLIYGGIPVFADIEEETFGLDPASVRKAVTGRTKAILAVNLFGHTARLDDLRRIAEEHGLYLVEDNAQGPLAEDHGRLAGTIGHIGVFSLNFHKHIHTGEGGMCVTNDDTLALRLKLIRNHAENVVEPLGVQDLTNLVGFNFRLTEIQAAVGREQLRNAETHVSRRERIARELTQAVEGLPGLIPPSARPGCRHVYYVWALRYDEGATGVGRSLYCKALHAEGFPAFEAYVRPHYLLPLFQKRIAIGSGGYPFNLAPRVGYERGACPVCERMHEKEFIGFEPCAYDVDEERLERLCAAVRKVHSHLDELRRHQGSCRES
ncbi:MAG: DegT/DnrJ/EryC1/StrS family aminotransferase [Thermodesulfobacteriota bacterium]